MKPQMIFSAVAAVCILMIVSLPRLAVNSQAGFAPAPVVQDAAAPQQDAAASLLDAAAAEAATQPAPQQAAIEQPTAAPLESAQGDSIPAPAPPTREPGAYSPAAQAGLPELEAFAASLAGGDPGTVAGLYAPGLFALTVRQQPGGASDYISDENGTVTQYAGPASSGVIGLLAHNTLSGIFFFKLRQGQELALIYGDGRIARYQISVVQNYQALSPYDTRSNFVDLSDPSQQIISHSELYQRVYTTAGQLVLQTCIEANGEPTWGRMFIQADPL